MVAFDILAFTHSRSSAQRYLLTHTHTHTHTDTHIHTLMLTIAFIAMCSNVLISIFQLPNPISEQRKEARGVPQIREVHEKD